MVVVLIEDVLIEGMGTRADFIKSAKFEGSNFCAVYDIGELKHSTKCIVNIKEMRFLH